jgi:hypothetical protein
MEGFQFKRDPLGMHQTHRGSNEGGFRDVLRVDACSGLSLAAGGQHLERLCMRDHAIKQITNRT